MHAKRPVLAESLKDPTIPPDLSEFVAARTAYLEVVNRVLTEKQLDGLVFPQSEAPLPGIFQQGRVSGDHRVRRSTSPGCRASPCRRGQYANGAPFALIFVGKMWSEADLLGFAYDYEQATRHRIVPELVETPYPVPAAND